jgi:dolichol-phosphate mannosyltransferase
VKLSVVIPARNEAANIQATVGELSLRLAREAIVHEIVVVDDGSIDGTSDVVLRLATRFPGVRLVRSPDPHGFGRAVTRGLATIDGDAVVIVMADGSDDPEDVVTYYYVLRDQAECAFGSRFIPGSRVQNYPRFKLLLNRIANTAIRWLFRIRYNDVTNAFKGYRAYVVRGCGPLLSPHFNLTVELPLKAIARGYTYAIMPIGWRNRTTGRSSFHIQEMGSRYLYIILVVWLERLLTKADYRRSVSDASVSWKSHDHGDERPGARAPGDAE